MKKVLLNLPMERQIEEIPFHEWEYMKNISLDAVDHRLLAILQEGSGCLDGLPRALRLPAKPCWKWIRRPEREGAIGRRAAILNRELGPGIVVIVAIRTSRHSGDLRKTFADGVAKIP